VSAAGACPICGGRLAEAIRYDARPDGETPFDLGGAEYERSYLRCEGCGHLSSHHELDLSTLYSGAYMDATYGGDRLARTYERIMSLPPERSDNVQRVRRLVGWLGPSGRALDVGSGLGVFPARMKEAGWSCTALDPDPRATAHARETVGVEAVEADFMAAGDLGSYDLVTFNKVLEHVEDPVSMLARAKGLLAPGASVYVELPDGEAAAAESYAREEFFIEHLHVFSMASLCILAARAGLPVAHAERLREPSGKYTLAALCAPPNTPAG
jgi:SAM-dependent methyltransferase